MRATLGLFNTYFWKSIYGPIMAFIFPTILLTVMGNIFNIMYVFPGIVALNILFIGVLSMPSSVMEMKNSTLLKYIGSAPVKTWRFALSVLLYYTFISIVSVMLLILMTMAIFSNDVFPHDEFINLSLQDGTTKTVLASPGGFKHGLFSGIFSPFGSFSFWVAIFIHIALCLATGLLICTFSKTPQKALTIGLIITIPSMFLSGMIISADIIAQSDFMQWVSRMIPFRYSTANIIVASTELDQIGDYLEKLTQEDLSLIFKNVVDDGVILIDGERVSSTHELLNYMKAFEAAGRTDDFYENIKDRVLFDLIFGQSNVEGMASSTNNIFNIVHSWGVKKVPDISQIQYFMQYYLSGVAGTNVNGDALEAIQDLIEVGDFRWMNDLFLEQPVTLFEIGDMICNLAVPTVLIGAFSVTTIKKFKWSAR